MMKVQVRQVWDGHVKVLWVGEESAMIDIKGCEQHVPLTKFEGRKLTEHNGHVLDDAYEYGGFDGFKASRYEGGWEMVFSDLYRKPINAASKHGLIVGEWYMCNNIHRFIDSETHYTQYDLGGSQHEPISSSQLWGGFQHAMQADWEIKDGMILVPMTWGMHPQVTVGDGTIIAKRGHKFSRRFKDWYIVGFHNGEHYCDSVCGRDWRATHAVVEVW